MLFFEKRLTVWDAVDYVSSAFLPWVRFVRFTSVPAPGRVTVATRVYVRTRHYNGGAVLAMVGKDCVAIGCDKRLGVQALTVSTEFPKVFKVHDRLFFGLAGLASDVATVHEQIRFKTNMYKLQENRDIEPKTLGHLISSTLYERRLEVVAPLIADFLLRFGPYFIEPVIAGIDKHGKPFICSADLIGCLNFAKDFVVAGVPSPNLFGMCEGLWEEGLVGRILCSSIRPFVLVSSEDLTICSRRARRRFLTPSTEMRSAGGAASFTSCKYIPGASEDAVGACTLTMGICHFASARKRESLPAI
ncbi:MAG: nucleophile aminohydrolase [Olpidium bornovanus]|uniref:Proteasome subunit beta n=1 Tax=Olpidium bornovanus TaxID=278681 RepID=A0A8H7ZR46_9FUNG|nr:MAG: nucleophile aminohydrolase [Olpidium bornovanus]